MNLRNKGFTLIELLVVMSIIAILSAVGYASFNDARKISRDAERQSDLRLLQSAIELYKQKNGVYPEGCNGPAVSPNSAWSGQIGMFSECASAPYAGTNEYIVGLAPEFIPVLPSDPNPKSYNGGNIGYLYITNTDRSVYKIMTTSVETDNVDENHEFFRCGTDYKLNLTPTIYSWEDPSVCRRVPTSAAQNHLGSNYKKPPNQCSSSHPEENQKVYALSGGYSNKTTGGPVPDKVREYDTEIVRCK